MRDLLNRWLASAVLAAVAAVAWAETDPAETVFAASEDRVFQIRVLDRATGNKASIGSGFHARSPGLVVTNFHVVAEAIFEPQRYRVEYVASNEVSGPLELRSVDVVHDLAVLQAPDLSTAPLKLRRGAIPQGTRIFSMGNPRDLGMTITGGAYNGPMEGSLYDKLMFSGSLNPGMSGGPALDRAGHVVGVNVATGGDDLGFLVPAQRLRKLLDEADDAGAADRGLEARIESQLRANQSRYMEELLAGEWQTRAFGPVRLPGEIAPFVQCWGQTSDEESTPYRVSRSQCATKDRIYLSRGFDTGRIAYRYRLINSDSLNPWRFYELYSQQYRRAQDFSGPEASDVTEFTCRDRFLRVADRPWKGAFCARRYKRFPAVFDSFLTLALVTDAARGVVIQVALTGVSREHAQRFVEKFLEHVTWAR